MSVHVLGAGAMGSLVAHELALGGKLAPTLILKSKRRSEAFLQNGSTISLLRPLGTEAVSSKAEMKSIYRPQVDHNGKPIPIENLIVSLKTYTTISALKPFLDNITNETTVLILQNGMGMDAKLKKEFWSDPLSVPRIYLAISTHGAYKSSPNSVHHVGLGSLTLLKIPETQTIATELEPLPELVKAIMDRPALNAVYKPYEEFLFVQMEKLVVNACINPLTAVLDCFNGEILNGIQLVQTMKRVIKECVDCFKAEYPHLQELPKSGTVLDYDRLLSIVMEVCKTTSQNSSSMREDVRSLNTTEIESINGHIVRLGYKHKVPTPTNRMLVNMVNSKLSIERSREQMALRKLIF